MSKIWIFAEKCCFRCEEMFFFSAPADVPTDEVCFGCLHQSNTAGCRSGEKDCRDDVIAENEWFSAKKQSA